MTLANSTCGAVHLRSLSRQKLGRNSAERHKCLQLVQTGSLGGTLPMASTTFCNQEASKSLTISLWYFCLAKSKGLLPQAANAARTKTIRVTSGSSNLRFIKDRFDDFFHFKRRRTTTAKTTTMPTTTITTMITATTQVQQQVEKNHWCHPKV